MTAKAVSFLLSDLGVTKTHSRPHVANDNPDSEAQFKTLKYQPQCPKQFGSIEDARTFFDAGRCRIIELTVLIAIQSLHWYVGVVAAIVNLFCHPLGAVDNHHLVPQDTALMHLR